MQVRLVRVVVGAQIRRAKNLGLYRAGEWGGYVLRDEVFGFRVWLYTPPEPKSGGCGHAWQGSAAVGPSVIGGSSPTCEVLPLGAFGLHGTGRGALGSTGGGGGA